jgi:hypothetical protein
MRVAPLCCTATVAFICTVSFSLLQFETTLAMKKSRDQGSVLVQQDVLGADAKRPRLHVVHGSSVGRLAAGASDDGMMKIDDVVLKSAKEEQQTSVSRCDTILQEMVTAGRYTPDEIIQFCLDAGIPLSRMLELDLMRLNRTTNNMA